MDGLGSLSWAVRHFDGRAANWYTRSETMRESLASIGELMTFMITEFVISIERAQAKTALVTLKGATYR